MKKEELRIGNLVNQAEDNFIVCVTGIKRQDGGCYVYGNNKALDYECWYQIHKYEPIPLTEEWLLKFGFEFVDCSANGVINNWKRGKFKIWDNKRGEYSYFGTTEIKYVHKLQNLYYAIMDEELIAAKLEDVK